MLAPLPLHWDTKTLRRLLQKHISFPKKKIILPGFINDLTPSSGSTLKWPNQPHPYPPIGKYGNKPCTLYIPDLIGQCFDKSWDSGTVRLSTKTRTGNGRLTPTHWTYTKILTTSGTSDIPPNAREPTLNTTPTGTAQCHPHQTFLLLQLLLVYAPMDFGLLFHLEPSTMMQYLPPPCQMTSLNDYLWLLSPGQQPCGTGSAPLSCCTPSSQLCRPTNPSLFAATPPLMQQSTAAVHGPSGPPMTYGMAKASFPDIRMTHTPANWRHLGY